jgi:hypothetical protein
MKVGCLMWALLGCICFCLLLFLLPFGNGHHLGRKKFMKRSTTNIKRCTGKEEFEGITKPYPMK